ncbi:MAG: Nudix family hydrolase [Burkholderiales bacterium]
MTRPTTHVVAAVLERVDGSYLLAQRPAGKVYAGYWEFPGGKVEPGESEHAALVREIREELGIEVRHAFPWIVRRHEYEHASVRIRFFRVTDWAGSPRGLDGQRFEFQQVGRESVGPMLPANGPVLAALRLPTRYAISCCSILGEALFLVRLEIALRSGLRMVLVREPTLDSKALERLTGEVLARCRDHGARVLVSANMAVAAAARADGVHLRAAQLSSIKVRPDFELICASTHDAHELERAAATGCDFAVLGPVLPTPSHPDSPGMGWDRMANLIADSALPVFALGGVSGEQLDIARSKGAHGIAMLRAAWR